MKQFILPQAPDHGGTVYLTGKDYHYLVRVRRYGVGTIIPVLVPSPSQPQQGSLRIIEIYEDRLVGEVTPRTSTEEYRDLPSANPDESPSPKGDSEQALDQPGLDRRLGGSPGYPQIHLWVGYPKARKLDQVIRQATELGVATIRPILCDRSIPDPDARGWAKKSQRYRRIIEEAVQQSGSPGIPELQDPAALERVIMTPTDGALGIYFHETMLAKEGLHDYLCPLPEQVYLLLGPEGGISPRERRLLQEHSWQPGYLGNSVLRCETAVVAALGAIKAICGEVTRWQINNR